MLKNKIVDRIKAKVEDRISKMLHCAFEVYQEDGGSSNEQEYLARVRDKLRNWSDSEMLEVSANA